MTFLDRLRKEKMEAMKNKDKMTNAVISNLMSEISLAEKEKGDSLTDAEAFEYVQKDIKREKDALESLPADRASNIEEQKKRIALLEAYLPQQLSDEEIEKEAMKIIEDQGLEKSPKSMGPIIKEILDKHQGQTDGASVSRVVGSLLK